MRAILIFFLCSSFLSSCGTNESQISEIPYRAVDLEIDLKSAVNKELWFDGGYKIFSGGYKGIIVYRENVNLYHAFDQGCTFDTENVCAKVVVDDSGLFLIDKCCNSTFNFSGMVTGGPAPQRLLEYPYFIDEFNILHVVN